MTPFRTLTFSRCAVLWAVDACVSVAPEVIVVRASTMTSGADSASTSAATKPPSEGSVTWPLWRLVAGVRTAAPRACPLTGVCACRAPALRPRVKSSVVRRVMLCPPSRAGMGVAALQVGEPGADGPVHADPEAVGPRAVTRARLAVVAGGGGKAALVAVVDSRAAGPGDAHAAARVGRRREAVDHQTVDPRHGGGAAVVDDLHLSLERRPRTAIHVEPERRLPDRRVDAAAAAHLGPRLRRCRDVELGAGGAGQAGGGGRERVAVPHLVDAQVREGGDTVRGSDGRGPGERPAARVGAQGDGDVATKAYDRGARVILSGDLHGWRDRTAGGGVAWLHGEDEVRRRRRGRRVECDRARQPGTGVALVEVPRPLRIDQAGAGPHGEIPIGLYGGVGHGTAVEGREVRGWGETNHDVRHRGAIRERPGVDPDGAGVGDGWGRAGARRRGKPPKRLRKYRVHASI